MKKDMPWAAHTAFRQKGLSVFLCLMACVIWSFPVAAQSHPELTTVPSKKITAQLTSIVLPKFELKGATIQQAVELLTKECKKADPDHQGINFVIIPDTHDSTYLITHPAKINLSLANATLKAALRAIRDHSGYGFSIQPFAINFHWSPPLCEGAYLHIITVPDGFVQLPPGQDVDTPFNVTSQLQKKGILFPVGSSATYIPSTRKLSLVHSEIKELDKIDDLIDQFGSPTSFKTSAPISPPIDPNTGKPASQRNQLTSQLDSMMIPKFELKNATLGDAIALLAQKSKEVDPANIGINFVIATPLPSSTFNLTLTNASLKKTLFALQKQTGYGYIVEDFDVRFVPGPHSRFTPRS